MEGNNYVKFAEQSRERFLTFDQEPLITKFHLTADDEYMQIRYLNTPFRIERTTGRTEYIPKGESAWISAPIHDTLTIYDMLCLHPEEPEIAQLNGEFVSVSVLGGIIGSGHAISLQDHALLEKFSGNVDRIRSICLEYGGKDAGKSGDVSVILPLFDFFPVWFQFWDGDDEFPPKYQFLFDRNALRFLHYETIWYAMESVTERIESGLR